MTAFDTGSNVVTRLRPARRDVAVSFEFFPPKTDEMEARFWESLDRLAPVRPRFVSVTYGAGGTTRQLTHEAVTTLGQETGLRVAAHLTCVGASRAETLAIAEAYAAAGVTDIVALRGDPPKGAGGFAPHPDGFGSSVELVAALAATGRFRLHVGAYPERHPDAADASADINWLKRKIDAGAGTAITQFFFEAETFFRFRDACAAAGIAAPIIPGILPVQNWAGTRRMAERCGTHVPGWLDEAFAAASRDGREDLLATALCAELCDELVEGGVEQLHFYTLNRPEIVRDTCLALGLQPKPRLERVA